MTDTSRSGLMQKVVLASVLVLVVGMGASYWYIEEARINMTDEVVRQIEVTRDTLSIMAELTDRNAADDAVGVLVKDCDNRPRFESILGVLNTASPDELREVRTLYDSCGGYFSLRKNVMVMRMQREADMLRTLSEIYTRAINKNTYTEIVSLWSQVVDTEIARAQLIEEQVAIQRDIIDMLLRGTTDGLDVHLRRAKEITESLSVQDTQVGTLKEREQQLWASIAQSE